MGSGHAPKGDWVWRGDREAVTHGEMARCDLVWTWLGMPSRVMPVRYLTSSFAVGAVRQGREISQLLGSFEEAGRRGLRRACIFPASRFEPIRVRLYEVEDLGPGTLPMDEFPGFYPEDDFDPDNPRLDENRRDEDGGRIVATAASAEEASVPHPRRGRLP
jgi:hypothetical protein